ncbi:unnamed protein product [Ilex paraguariensis]|uniref:HhH-GPD domain-containing protein n=1 Tax=Ilex paraguariensis TaxID=185542 RepID=A0ABC8U9T9_9AQUA
MVGQTQAQTTETQPQPTTDPANAPPENPSPTTKIPFRPRKIRKLSPKTSSDSKSSQSTATENPKTTTESPKTAATATESPKITTTSKPSKSKLTPSSQPKPIVPTLMARSLSCEGEIEIALRHLRTADPILSSLIDHHQPPIFDSFHSPFLALSRSILYQQLAYKAGTSIYTRFVSLCGGESGVLPETILSLTPHQLRQVGISNRKASYLHDLARKYQNGILSDSSILELDDKSLFTMLTMVNGIGSWSVHMFMIFSLHRPDVLPVNDLGVRKGVQMLYGLEELPKPSQMEQLCEKWRPYRSVAAWYMWRFVEAKGSNSSAAVVTGENLQQQQQQQFLDPINGILNFGACAWGQ